MIAKSTAPSFMQPKTRRQETAATTAAEGAKRIGGISSAVKDKSKGGDTVSRIQQYAKEQGERDKKAAAEKKKKPAASVAPSKGFFGKMVDKYYYGKKEE